jgi:hypothetical protein
MESDETKAKIVGRTLQIYHIPRPPIRARIYKLIFTPKQGLEKVLNTSSLNLSHCP